MTSPVDDVAIMAPGSSSGDGGSFRKKVVPGGRQRSQQKQRWRASHFKKGWGNVREGQGFAFQQKEKIKHDYKKILRKERKAKRTEEVQFTENYPDHLRHLYLAEEELVKKQSEKAKKKEIETNDQPTLQAEGGKRRKIKSSYQKIIEEFERKQAEKLKQREAAEKRQQEKEEAQRKYKEEKLERYRILSKKTRKGQPNLNLQMEYLLKKIQENQGIK
ncbi:thyroid transcription factor 1-associated protein 26-like [Chiloscyllium punctatum]